MYYYSFGNVPLKQLYNKYAWTCVREHPEAYSIHLIEKWNVQGDPNKIYSQKRIGELQFDLIASLIVNMLFKFIDSVTEEVLPIVTTRSRPWISEHHNEPHKLALSFSMVMQQLDWSNEIRLRPMGLSHKNRLLIRLNLADFIKKTINGERAAAAFEDVDPPYEAERD